MDLNEVFGLTVAPLELILRGTLIYWFIFLLFRFVARRDAGAIAITDVLVVVLIADAAQNGMSADYRSVTDAMILIGTIVVWNVVLDWAAWVSPVLRRVLVPPTLALVRDGRLIERNMRRQLLTEDELMEKLRDHGIGSLAEVKAAFLESSGDVSVVKRSGATDDSAASKRRKTFTHG
ncbi:MAG TPA: YetF domain-containing protein [Burkholderiaceae bacterium]|nr:YetF domain-containing protein [Burkholderiaceae bacterium]